VCVCVCMYVCMCVCVYVCICICVYLCMCVCVYVFVYVYMYVSQTSIPLVFSLHGFGGSAVGNMAYTNFNLIADTADFIVIYPQGAIFQGFTHWNVGGWIIGSPIDDVGFFNALLDTISNSYNIDPKRVYSTGMSNGGFMSFLLACQLNDRIAAIASVTGSMTPQTYNECNPQHPTPILQIHGDADGTVPYNGAAWTQSINEVLQYWVAYNNCNSTPTTITLPDINMRDGSTVEYIVYNECDNDITTEHYKVLGGDHDWPGAWGNMDIDASVEVWKFFSKYDIDGLIGGIGVGVNDPIESGSNFIIFPNPTQSLIYIKGNIVEPLDFEIISLLGKRVIMGTINATNQQIDLSQLSPNIYILKVGKSYYKFLKI